MLTNDPNPMQHFQKWFFEADEIFHEQEPNAMLLSTIASDNTVSSRMVLLKKYTWEGFIFFTNYNSHKAKAISNNDKVSLFFNWKKSKRQLLIKGKAERIPKHVSENYFALRPRGSQIAAWASEQSQLIPSRNVIENQLTNFQKKFKNQDIPKPNRWGGYLIKPVSFEFIDYSKNSIPKSTFYTMGNAFYWLKT